MAASALGSAWDSDDAMEVDDAVAKEFDDLPAPSQPYRRAIPTAPYTSRIPETPHKQPGFPQPYSGKEPGIKPSERNLSFLKLSPQDLYDGTRNCSVQKVPPPPLWQHNMRDRAHALLNYMFVGPTCVLSNHDFLAKNDFSLAVVIRHERLAVHPSQYLEKARAVFPGITEMYINKLIWSTSELCRYIVDLNTHMVDKKKEGRTGKILITCESGNVWSAFLATCYIMAIYDKPWLEARDFVISRRTSINLGTGDMQHRLEVWQSMLEAGSDVAASGAAIEDQKKRQTSKRGADNMLEPDIRHDDGSIVPDYDADRFKGREPFVPFIDID